MKKVFFFFAAALTGLAFTACSQDDEIVSSATSSKDAALSSITVQLPSDATTTRAWGDGTTAKYLSYAVYKVTGDDADPTYTYVDGKTNQYMFTDGLSTTLPLELSLGFNYQIVFWAQDAPSNCPYTVTMDATGAYVKMDYSDKDGYMYVLNGNNESRDAFWNSFTTGTVTGDFTATVPLYRPFAQLNIGTDDMEKEIVSSAYNFSTMSVTVQLPSSLPTKMDLHTGKVSSSDVTEFPVEFRATGVPETTTTGTFPVDGYSYLSMNYILVGIGDDSADEADVKTTCDAVTITFLDESMTGSGLTYTVENVPFKRNYRTNLYGTLFSTTTAGDGTTLGGSSSGSMDGTTGTLGTGGDGDSSALITGSTNGTSITVEIQDFDGSYDY